MRRTRAAGVKPTGRQLVSTLDKLAELIRETDRLVLSTMGNSLEHARRCGELLNHAKRLVEWGKWEIWVKDKTKIAPRTARAYRQLARLGEVEWRKRRSKVVHAALWGASDSMPPEEGSHQPDHDEAGGQPHAHEDPDPTNGPQWTDPARPAAELHQMQSGIGEEGELKDEEYYEIQEAELMFEAMIRRLLKRVGRKVVEHLLKKFLAKLDELESGSDAVH